MGYILSVTYGVIVRFFFSVSAVIFGYENYF